MIKIKTTCLLVIMLSLFTYAQQMNIHTQSGTDIYNLAEIDSITFVDSSSILIVQPDSSDGIDVWITSVYYGGGLDNEELKVGGWADYYYSLIMFDISDLPSNVSSAKIMLYCYTNNKGANVSMYLDRITSSWTENTKWQNRPNYINETELLSPTINAWYEIDITSIYNGWKLGTFTNYGIQLRPTGISNQFNFFHSSDYVIDPTLRPKLIINP